MGGCIKKPMVDKVSVENEVDVNGNNCCFDISDHCPSTCCVINIYRRKSKKDLEGIDDQK